MIQDQTLIQCGNCGELFSSSDEIHGLAPAECPRCGEEDSLERAVCGINGDVAGTLDASYYKGCGERQGVEREVVMTAAFKRGNVYTARTLGYAEEVAPTLSSAENGTNRTPTIVTTVDCGEQHGVATYDARGNGDGDVCCTLTGDHQDRVTDYTALVVENDPA